MPRDLTINIYHEHEITDLLDKHGGIIMKWCEDNMISGWNIIADSGGRAVRYGRHYVMLLCVNMSDMMSFMLTWR